MPPLTLTTDPSTPLIPTHLQAPLLDLLQDPALTFRDIAQQLGLAPGVLIIFLASDEGAELVQTIERANTLRARVAAAASLPLVATVLNRILEDFLNSSDPVLSNDAPEETRLRAARSREAQRVNARRTAQALLRLLAPPSRRRTTPSDAATPRSTDPTQAPQPPTNQPDPSLTNCPSVTEHARPVHNDASHAAPHQALRLTPESADATDTNTTDCQSRPGLVFPTSLAHTGHPSGREPTPSRRAFQFPPQDEPP